MNITLKQVAAFRAVAEARSFTRAARELKLAQPVLSAHVRELEQSLGARLFDRTTRSVDLTDAGREFFASTGDIIPRLREAVELVQDVTERKRGRLSLAAPPLLAASLLPGVMAQYKAAHPGIEIALLDMPTEVIIEKLLRHEVDIAIATQSGDDPRFARTVLLRDQLILLVSNKTVPSPASSVKWSELKQFPVITLAAGSGIRALTDKAAASAGIVLTPAYEVMQVMTAIEMVRAGLGVAVLPSYAGAANAFGAQTGLTTLPIYAPAIQREVSILHLNGRSLSPAAAGFIDMLRAQVARGAQA